MRKCPKCNTILEDDELFCHECGTKQKTEKVEVQNEETVVPSVKKCAHCERMIEEDSTFCPFCGKPQIVEKGEIPEHIQETIEEDTTDEVVERKTDIKKWLWPVISILLIVLIGGGYYYLNHKEVDLSTSVVAVNPDSVVTVNSEYDIHTIEGVKQRLNEIMSKGLDMQENDAVKKYYSKEFNGLYFKVDEIDKRSSGEIGFWEGNLWDGGQDGITGFKIDRVYNMSDKTVEADVSTIYDYGEYHSENVQHYILVFENNNWYIDENLTWEFKKNMKEYVSDENLYLQALYENAIGEDKTCEYFLYDITKDGIPELWIVAGTCEADRELIVYTHEAKEIFRKGADHSAFYRGNDYILQQCAHMRYAAWMKIYRNGDKICEEKIFEEDTNKTETDYTEPSEPLITLIPCDNTSPIHNAFRKR